MTDLVNLNKAPGNRRVHCVKSVQIQSFSGPYFPVFSPNTGKYGPEETPYLDTFRVVVFIHFY